MKEIHVAEITRGKVELNRDVVFRARSELKDALNEHLSRIVIVRQIYFDGRPPVAG
jgi:hypothetical protein